MAFGRFRALSDLSFAIEPGEIFGVAGPNGAGKSTLLNVCTGLLVPTEGKIRFGAHKIGKLSPDQCAKIGVCKTFQIPTVIGSMTVLENVQVGRDFAGRGKGGPSVHAILDLLDLNEAQHDRADASDLLTRKRIMFGGALATGARIVFMDEPLGGLNQDEIKTFCAAIARVNAELGTTIVMVEHKTRALAELSNRILILNFGRQVCLDKPERVMSDPEVIDIYLGNAHHA